MTTRIYSTLDRLIMDFDQLITTLFVGPESAGAERPSPADAVEEASLSAYERRCSAGLMRVNHTGEISAQALYEGQARIARDPVIQALMVRSAAEEIDHLAWCRQRLNELGGRTSYLNPVWYLGSFTIGMLAGLAGDKWSLGFVAETERQVVEHLRRHLERLPARDAKSRAIVQQMAEDEARHGATAMASGGVDLPEPVKLAMHLCSRVMTTTAYWI